MIIKLFCANDKQLRKHNRLTKSTTIREMLEDSTSNKHEVVDNYLELNSSIHKQGVQTKTHVIQQGDLKGDIRDIT